MKRLHLYLIREMLLPFGLSLTLISFLLLMNKLLSLVDLVLKNGVPAGQVLRLVAYILPATFAITVPMSLLAAVLLALGRLASDLELVAMRAGGVSLRRLYPAALGLGLAFSLGMLAFNESALPRANEGYRELFREVLRQRSDAVLQAKVWVRDFKGMLVYVEAKDPASGELRGVTVLRPGPGGQPVQWIRARAGRLLSDAGGDRLFLELYEGGLQVPGGRLKEDLSSLRFRRSRFDLDLGGALSQMQARELQPQEMGMRQIWRAAAAMPAGDPRRAHWLTEMHKKASIPFACLFFVLCAFPLGTLTRRGGRMLGFVIAIALIFVYYLLLSLGQTYGDEGRLPAALAMWLPNLALAALAWGASRGAFQERGIFAFSRG